MKSFITLLALSTSLFLGVLSSPLRIRGLDNIETRNSGAVKFYLYTKANPANPQKLVLGDVNSVKSSNFDKSRQTK